MQITNLDCPITHERMIDPVIAPDGYTYERSAIERWIREHHTSPLDPSKRIDSVANLTPNRIVRDLLEEAAAGGAAGGAGAVIAAAEEELISPEVRAKIQETTKATIHTNSVNADQSIVHIEPRIILKFAARVILLLSLMFPAVCAQRPPARMKMVTRIKLDLPF